jgi:hypothetical protein
MRGDTMNEDWKKTLNSVSHQLHELNIHTNKDFKVWINQNPQEAQKLIRTLANILLSIAEPLQEETTK